MSLADAVLIDLDGTLLDTVPDLAAGVNAMRAAFDLPALPVETVAAYVGKGAEVLVHRAMTDDMNGRVEDAARFARARDAFFLHYGEANGRHAALYPYVMEGLEAMREGGLSLGCVTNKPAAFTGPLLERTGLAEYFDVVVCGDTLPERKPDPAPMLHAARALGAMPARTVVIGDSVNDVQAARAAGMRAFVVPYGYNEGRPAGSLDADERVDDLLDAACRLLGDAARPQD